MPRPRKDTEQVVCRIDCNLMSKLKLINPSLITRDASSGKMKYRHGALGKYISRLIAQDIAKREELHKDDLLKRFTP